MYQVQPVLAHVHIPASMHHDKAILCAYKLPPRASVQILRAQGKLDKAVLQETFQAVKVCPRFDPQRTGTPPLLSTG